MTGVYQTLFVWRTIGSVLSLTDYFTDFFLKSSFLSEINVYGVVLAADSEYLGLNIEIWLKTDKPKYFTTREWELIKYNF